jgi:hypothetical protein
MLLLDEDRAVEAIPDVLAKDPYVASRTANNLRKMIDVVGLRADLAKTRLERIGTLIEIGKQHGHARPTDREAREHAAVRAGRASPRSRHH